LTYPKERVSGHEKDLSKGKRSYINNKYKDNHPTYLISKKGRRRNIVRHSINDQGRGNNNTPKSRHVNLVASLFSRALTPSDIYEKNRYILDFKT